MKDVLLKRSYGTSADEKVRSAQEQHQRLSLRLRKADMICKDAAQEAERLRDGVSQIRNVRNSL